MCGRGGGLLIGVDLKKDPMTLNRAYNDALCITAAFNLNILGRLNRELRANFALDHFGITPFSIRSSPASRYTWSASENRWCDSMTPSSISIGARAYGPRPVQTQPTEFAARAAAAGRPVKQVRTDDRELFSVQHLSVLQAAA